MAKSFCLNMVKMNRHWGHSYSLERQFENILCLRCNLQRESDKNNSKFMECRSKHNHFVFFLVFVALDTNVPAVTTDTNRKVKLLNI